MKILKKLYILFLLVSFAFPVMAKVPPQPEDFMPEYCHMQLIPKWVEKRNFRNVSKLFKAAFDGDYYNAEKYVELFPEQLVSFGENTGMNTLHAAAYNGHTEIVRLLLNSGLDVDIEAEYWTSQTGDFHPEPIHFATARNFIYTSETLRDNGAAIKGKYSAILIEPILRGHYKMVRFLLENGADPEAVNPEIKISPLMAAKCPAGIRNPKIKELLEEHIYKKKKALGLIKIDRSIEKAE